MIVIARRGLLVFCVASLGAAAWLFWPVPATPQPSVTPPRSATAIPAPGLLADPPAKAAPAEDGTGGVPETALDWRDQSTRDRLIEAARRHCSWPPDPSSWYTLDEACETALNRFLLTEDWRLVLENPLATRHAVVAAFENPECRPHMGDPRQTSGREWRRRRGEDRPELREECAADAMARLADLQHKCVERLHTDWATIHDQAIDQVDRMAAQNSFTQDRYYRLIEDDHFRRTGIYWETHMCRSVHPGAFEWVDALPEPLGDPVAPRYNRPAITQYLDLYDAAERLGADIPEAVSGFLESYR